MIFFNGAGKFFDAELDKFDLALKLADGDLFVEMVEFLDFFKVEL